MTDQRPQPESGQTDPFAVWRQIYEANEQVWTKALKETMTTQGYAEAQGKMIEVLLSYQKMLREAINAQLTSLNLASRDDVSRLGELVVGLEEKIDQLDDGSDEKLGGLEKRLVQIERKLSGLGDTVGQLSQRLTKVQDLLAKEQKAAGGNGQGSAAPAPTGSTAD